MATVIRKTYVRSPRTQRRRNIAKAGVVFALLLSYFLWNPGGWSNPIPESARSTAVSAIEKGQLAQTGVSSSSSASSLADQQQTARKAIDLLKSAMSEDTLGASWHKKATLICFKYCFLCVPLLFILWFFMRKRNKTELGETVLMCVALVLISAFAVQSAKYAQYPEKYARYGVTCEWSDKCSGDKMIALTENQTVIQAFVDVMYGSGPEDTAAAFEHAKKILEGKPFSTEEQTDYYNHSKEFSEGKRTLAARTARGYTASRNSVLYVFGYITILLGLLCGLVRLLLLPFLVATWAMPSRAMRQKALRISGKVIVSVHIGFFVSLAILVGFNWISVLIPKYLELFGYMCWPISLMLIMPLCWAIFFVVVKTTTRIAKQIMPTKRSLRVR